MIISIWVIIGFLLLRAGSLRYWTAAFVVLLVVVGFGDHLPARALLVAVLASQVLFVVPAASRSGQRVPLLMALISLVPLAGLVVTGGVRYWLPALIVAFVVVPLGVPLLWAEPRDRGPGVEVRLWPRRRGPRLPKQSTPADSGPAPPEPERPEPEQPEPEQPEPDEQPGSEEKPPPPPPRNVRQFPPGRRPDARPPAQNRPQRQRRPPAAS